MDLDSVSIDVPIKFGDSMSNGFRDIRGADFVSIERSLVKPISIAFCLKIDDYEVARLDLSVTNFRHSNDICVLALVRSFLLTSCCFVPFDTWYYSH